MTIHITPLMRPEGEGSFYPHEHARVRVTLFQAVCANAPADTSAACCVPDSSPERLCALRSTAADDDRINGVPLCGEPGLVERWTRPEAGRPGSNPTAGV